MNELLYTFTNRTTFSLIKEMIDNNEGYKFLDNIMSRYIDAKDVIEA